MKEMSAQVLHVNTFQKVVKGIYSMYIAKKKAPTYNNDNLNHPFTFGYFVTCITCTSLYWQNLYLLFLPL